MRKLFAFILLFPLAILFIGSVNLTSFCLTGATTACTQDGDQCCQTATCARPHAPKNDQKTDRRACCFDCPLCALITIPNFIAFHHTSPEKTTEYAVIPDNLITGYYPNHWKPPDTAPLT